MTLEQSLFFLSQQVQLKEVLSYLLHFLILVELLYLCDFCERNIITICLAAHVRNSVLIKV